MQGERDRNIAAGRETVRPRAAVPRPGCDASVQRSCSADHRRGSLNCCSIQSATEPNITMPTMSKSILLIRRIGVTRRVRRQCCIGAVLIRRRDDITNPGACLNDLSRGRRRRPGACESWALTIHMVVTRCSDGQHVIIGGQLQMARLGRGVDVIVRARDVRSGGGYCTFACNQRASTCAQSMNPLVRTTATMGGRTARSRS